MSQQQPLIAIIPNRKPADYVTSVERAGARTLVVDRVRTHARDVLDDVAGVLLTGGGDVDPTRYGEPADASFEAAEEGRDEYETQIIALAIARQLPLLAICRGVQILNVALGGTLIQDIPSQHGSSVNHQLTDPKWALAHDVTVAADSRLHAALRDRISASGTMPVNSRHHQAIKDVAPGLRVTATAPDGIVEAVERPGEMFCLGVQWHPENFLTHDEFGALFRAFVEAATVTAGTAR